MKLRLTLFISLIFHLFVFWGMQEAIWQFLFSQEAYDLTTLEVVETIIPDKPLKSVISAKKTVPSLKPATNPEIAETSSSHESPTDTSSAQKDLTAVSVGAVTEPPKVLQEKRIAYPERARRAGVEGIVELKLVIDPEGNVREAELSKGLGFGLDEAALEAIKEFKFSPAKMGAAAVAVRIIYKYRFQLNR